MQILKHEAVGQFYRPIFDVAAGSVDLREANSVSGKEACLSAGTMGTNGFVFLFDRTGAVSSATPTAKRGRKRAERA